MTSTHVTKELGLKALLTGFKFYKKSGYKLSSGKYSNFYYDLKLAIGNPEILYQICGEIFKKVSDDEKIKSIGGIETGSIPIASAFVLYYSIISKRKLSFYYIRKERKSYGTEKMIEGVLRPSAVLIDDVMMQGNSVKEALYTAKENHQRIDKVIPIIYRGDDESLSNLQQRLKVVIDPIFMEKDFIE